MRALSSVILCWMDDAGGHPRAKVAWLELEQEGLDLGEQTGWVRQ